MINNKDYTGVALSRNMAITTSRRGPKVLFYRMSPIGTVKDDGSIYAPNFEMEIANEIK